MGNSVTLTIIDDNLRSNAPSPDWGGLADYLLSFDGRNPMSEAEFVRKMTDNLNARGGVYVIRTNTGPHGKRGTPDILGSYNGQMFVIEAKLEGNSATQIQQAELAKWRKSGALACVLTYRPGTNIGRLLDAVLHSVERGESEYVQT